VIIELSNVRKSQKTREPQNMRKIQLHVMLILSNVMIKPLNAIF